MQPFKGTRQNSSRPSLQSVRSSTRYLVQTVPGLEEIAVEEIASRIPEAELVGAWRQFDERASLLEFRSDGDPRRWLALGTVEDVFALVARGRSLHTDRGGLAELAAATLSSKHVDRAMSAFAACRMREPRTFRVVARKSGRHEFRRVDAQRAVEGPLRTRIPSLRPVPDNADAEFWLTIIGPVALLGVRLSTVQMRQRVRPLVSMPASLKPTIARAMVLLSRPRDDQIVLDPCCGAGTLLIERALAARSAALYGGDRDHLAVVRARANAQANGIPIDVQQWDALALPLPDASVHVVLTNPPFGKKVPISDGDPYSFYRRLLGEIRRVLRPRGRLVLVTGQGAAFTRGARALPSPLTIQRRVPVLIRGERATIFVADR